MTEGYGTIAWRCWQKFRDAMPARALFRDRPPMSVPARLEWDRDRLEGADGVATWKRFDGAIFVELKDSRC